MKASEGHAMLLAKRPWLRKLNHGFFGIGGAVMGIGILCGTVPDYLKTHNPIILPLIIAGVLFPFILLGGEMYRYRIGAKKVKCVRCKDCNREFPIADIYKTGKCPSCGSKHLVGIRHDGSTI